jgi:hypothetical protein
MASRKVVRKGKNMQGRNTMIDDERSSRKRGIDMNKNIFKSIWAVLAGFLVIVILSVGTDFILEAAGVLPYDHLFVSTGLILVVLFYRAVYSLIGCYIAAKLAPHNPMKHALALGVLGFNTIGAIAAGHLRPLGSVDTCCHCLPIAWLGGKLYLVRSQRLHTSLCNQVKNTIRKNRSLQLSNPKRLLQRAERKYQLAQARR